MNLNKIFGLIFTILGLVFIIFPMFSADLVSIIIGLSLLFFGIASLINGFSTWSYITHFTTINIIIGVISIIFGLLFICFIDALSFLIGFGIYIIGFIMIAFGIVGLISDSKISKASSFLILIIGIVAIALAVFAVAKPIYVAILIGVCLLIQGIMMFISD